MTMFLTIEAFLLKYGASSYMKSSLQKSAKHSLKLGKRLQQIEKMATSQEYGHIWDCCCDHGLLGCALLNRQADASDTDSNMPVNIASNTARIKDSDIHFVDIVPELMAELENKLQRFYSTKSSNINSSSSSRWQTHCLDVTKLPLAQYQGKHLVIIAGVGGDLMIKFIEAIYQKHKDLNIDFLLCPVHHQYPLRSKLIELDFSLKDEMLMEENSRFYEILLVSTSSKVESKISPVGDKIWLPETQKKTETAKKYLNKTLRHYQRMQLGFQQNSVQQNKVQGHKQKNNDVQHIIDAYASIQLMQ